MQKRFLKPLALALTLVAAIGLPAFGAGAAEGDTLKIALSSEPSGLYPQFTYSKPAAAIQMCLFDTLVSFNLATKKVEPRLATSWKWIDATHIRFTLRDGVTFADGSPLTAEDVVFTFQYGCAKNGSSYARIFDANNCKAENARNVVLALNRPYPTLMDLIGCDIYGIISKKAVEAAGGNDAAARNPKIGSGKYKFVEWKQGQYVLLERNDKYWDKAALPYYKYIKFTFIGDAAARAMAVESGDVDAADELAATQIEGLIGNKSLSVVIENTSTNRTIYMNCSKGPLADPKVREAIFWLVDASAIRKIANAGYGELAETNFSRFNTVYAAPGKDFVRKVDVARAKDLLAQAGYKDGLEIGIMMPFSSTNQTIGEIVQANLAAGGIKATVNLPEIGSFLTQLWAGKYDITITSGDQYDYAKLLYMVDGRIDPKTASGGAQYTDQALIALLDKAYVEADAAKRKALYADIQAYLRKNFVAIGICNELRIVCTRSAVTGITFNLTGYPDFTMAKPAKK